MAAGSLIQFFRTRPDLRVTGTPVEIARRLAIRRWVTFLGVTLGYAVFYTIRLSLSVAKKPMIDAHLFTADDLGSIGSALLLAYAFGKVVNGFFADRAHVGRLMGAGLVGSALLSLAFGFTVDVSLLIALWFVNGWFQSMGATPAIVNLSHWFGPRERGTRYSIWSSAHSIGEGMTYFGTAALVTLAGWKAAFIGPGLGCLAVGIALFWVVHDRPQTYGLPDVSGTAGDAPARPAAKDASVTARQMRMLRNPYVWVLALAGALFYMSRYGVNNWMVFYLQESKGYSLMEAGALMSVLTFSGLVGTILLGPISDFFFRSRRGPIVTLYGLLLVGALFALMSIAPGHVWMDRVALAVCGFAVGGTLVVLGGLGVVDICPKGTSGAAVGVTGFCCYLGASLQDKVSGKLIDAGKTTVDGVVRYDFTLPMVFWIGAAVLSLLFASVLWWAKPSPG